MKGKKSVSDIHSFITIRIQWCCNVGTH